MTTFDKYLKGETLTEDEMFDLVPYSRIGASFKLQGDHIEMSYRDNDEGIDYWTFKPEEIIAHNLSKQTETILKDKFDLI